MGVNVAEKIDRLRGNRSNADLAAACACPVSNIQNYRTGTMPPLSIGIRLAETLGVPADWLGDDTQDWPPPATDEQTATGLVQQALAGAGLAGELAEDERTLLTGWRRLPDGPRQRILGMMQGFLDAGEAYKSTDPKDLQLLRDVEALLKRDAGRAQQPPKPEERTA